MRKIIERNRVVCTAWYETEDYMWMCLADRNAICKVEKKTGKVCILGSYPRNDMVKSLLCNEIVCVGNILVFVPYCANDIALLNLESEELTFLPMDSGESDLFEENNIFDARGKFTQAFVKEQYVYFWGLWYPGVIRLNPFTKEIDYLYKFDEEVKAPFVALGQAVLGEKIVMPIAQKKYLFFYDFRNEKIEMRKYENLETTFFSIMQNEQEVWITSGDLAKKLLIKWDVNKDTFEYIPLLAEGLYHEPIVYGKDIYLFPYIGKKVLIVNFDNRKCVVCNELSSVLSSGDWAKVMAVKKINNKIKYLIGGSREWYEYDLDSKKLERYHYEINDAENGQLWQRCMEGKIKGTKVLNEGREIVLSEYLTFLQTVGDNSGIEEYKCGDKILKILKEI